MTGWQKAAFVVLGAFLLGAFLGSRRGGNESELLERTRRLQASLGEYVRALQEARRAEEGWRGRAESLRDTIARQDAALARLRRPPAPVTGPLLPLLAELGVDTLTVARATVNLSGGSAGQSGARDLGTRQPVGRLVAIDSGDVVRLTGWRRQLLALERLVPDLEGRIATADRLAATNDSGWAAARRQADAATARAASADSLLADWERQRSCRILVVPCPSRTVLFFVGVGTGYVISEATSRN